MKSTTRCPWCGTDPLYVEYHDREWGVPCRDDDKLFEFLVLESAQAGLSWITILRKRENYRAAYHQFDPEKVARYDENDVLRLLGNPGIVRNRLKIEASINNARQFLAIRESHGTFADYFWQFSDGRPIINNFRLLAEVPANTPLSDQIAKDMKKRGFRFFGSTTCYAHMQAMGMVNDHLMNCHRHRECAAIR